MEHKKTTSVLFEDLAKADLTRLWAMGAQKEGWPEEFSTIDIFFEYAAAGLLSTIQESGQIKGVWFNGTLSGFVSLHQVGCGIFNSDMPVFEGGTYLLPSVRSHGLNKYIKEYLIKTSFETFGGAWCIFCIPIQNARAIRAMEKLQPLLERVTLQDTNHPLYRYVKWKSWQAQLTFVLFGISRKDYCK